MHLCAIVVAVRRHAWLRRVELRALWGPPWPSTRPPPTPTPTEAQLRIILLLEPADVILMLLDGLWLSLAVPRGRGCRSPGRASHHALWADATGEERPAHVQQGECRIFLAVVHRRPRVVRVVVPRGIHGSRSIFDSSDDDGSPTVCRPLPGCLVTLRCLRQTLL